MTHSTHLSAGTVASSASTLTVADVLAFPELAAPQPTASSADTIEQSVAVVAGAAGLNRTLRWAHVVAGLAAIELLDGGELVLTTGAGWPTDDHGLSKLATTLVGHDPAAVILELGSHFDAAPPALVAACQNAGIPLVEVRREVRFVQITQRIHQRVLDAQNEALEARAEVHAMLTDLGLNRSPVDYVIERLSAELDAPVVLEDSARHVVAWAGEGLDADTLLAPWARATERAFELPEGWERVSVEAQGKRWGQLTALPGPRHPAGRRTVLELGAFALALGRHADGSEEQWLRLSSKQLFDVLLSGRYRREAELSTQLAASGLPLDGRVVLGATLRGTGDFGSHETLERAVLETALRRAVAPEGRVVIAPDTAQSGQPTLLALLSFAPQDARVQVSQPHPLAARLAHEIDMLLPDTTPRPWRAHLALGAPGSGLRSLITSLEHVRAAGLLAPTAQVGRVTVQQAERQPLAYLMRRLAALPEVQKFTTDTLGPLFEHDAVSAPGHAGDLVRVLESYLAHPTNRSLAAQEARLSRSVFYQRIALIEELLGVDLADGTTIATLTVALLARG